MAAAAGFAGADAEGDGKEGTEDGGGEIDPEVLKLAADEGGGERSGWIHRGAADRAGEEGFEGNDGSHGDPGGDALLLGSGGDAEDDDHEDEGEDDLEDKTLHGGSGRKGGSEAGVSRKEKPEEAAGGEGARNLGEEIEGTSRTAKRPEAANARVTAGLKWAPLTSPKV